MPYVSISTPRAIEAPMADMLQREIGRMITIIPGKNKENCMIKIEGGCSMFMGGGAKNVVFCEVRMFTEAPQDKKQTLCKELSDMFVRTLQAEAVYINFQEYDEWGAGGRLLGT